MTEKIYVTKKNGMRALILNLLFLAAAIAAIVFGAVGEESGQAYGIPLIEAPGGAGADTVWRL